MTEIASNNLLVTIRLSYNQFTRTEKKIADYVLDNAAEVPFMSITELAEACEVAEASVHRFCRTIHVKGYQEFKMQLSLSLKDGEGQFADRGNNRENPDSGSPGSGEDLFSEILNYHLSAIRETHALLDPETVDRTVDMMCNARQIMFAGVGNSMLTAQEAQGRFLHITSKTIVLPDTHLQAMMASLLTPEDMVIFISYSGSTTDNIRVAKLARQRGAKIAAITRYPRSALTRYADTVLICGSKEGPLEGGSMGARMSQLHIIEILFQSYYRRNMEKSRTNNKMTAEAIVDQYEEV